MTGDSKYTNAAILSANWIKNHNINSGNIVLDSQSGADCSRSSSSWIFTYNSGKFIEGLAILYDVTKDPQWNQLLVAVFPYLYLPRFEAEFHYFLGCLTLLLLLSRTRHGKAPTESSPRARVLLLIMMESVSRVCLKFNALLNRDI